MDGILAEELAFGSVFSVAASTESDVDITECTSQRSSDSSGSDESFIVSDSSSISYTPSSDDEDSVYLVTASQLRSHPQVASLLALES